MKRLTRNYTLIIPLFLCALTLASAAIADIGTVNWSVPGMISFCDTGGGISYTPKFNYSRTTATNQCCAVLTPKGKPGCQFTLHYNDGSMPDSVSNGVGSTAASGSVTSDHKAYTLTGYPGSANYYTVLLNAWCRSVFKAKINTTSTPVQYFNPSVTITVYGKPCPQ